MGNETKAVRVGGVWMGAGAPISVQSMTNTYTGDVEATTAQVRQLAEAGCEIVRMAVNDVPAAAAVREIRARTRVPLVADIHFDYRLAIASIENGIDKIRFNPGHKDRPAASRPLLFPFFQHAPDFIKETLRRAGQLARKSLFPALEHHGICPAEGDADLRLPRLARAVHRAAHYRNFYGVGQTR